MGHLVEPSTPGDGLRLILLWNRCIGERFPMSERLLDQNLEGGARTTAAASLVVREGQNVIGWVVARAHRAPPPALERLRGTGGLTVLCVDPYRRNRGIGTALLAAAEEHLASHGVARFDTVVTPFQFLPGVPEEAAELDAFLERHGYALTGTCMDMEADVGAFERARGPAPGVDVRPVREPDEPALRALLAREFAAVWGYLIDDHLARSAPREDLLVAVEGDEVIGFCHVHDERSPALAGSTSWYPELGPRYGGLGPIGVSRAHRGRGLGLALLCAALEHQRRRGVRRMVIDWTTLESFYGRVGFSPWRRYRQRARAR